VAGRWLSDDEHFGVCSSQQRPQLAVAQRHVQGQHHRAGGRDGHVQDQELPTVRQVYRHHVAGPDPYFL
jgi:hypothetical protein